MKATIQSLIEKGFTDIEIKFSINNGKGLQSHCQADLKLQDIIDSELKFGIHLLKETNDKMFKLLDAEAK